MPSPYARHAARLKAEIVARVAAGEVERVICGEAGMPGRHTVANWAKADPDFGAELALARTRGEWRRVWMFDEAAAGAFLARARAGETINSLLGAPGMPSRRVYRYWQATQGPFAEAVFALRQRRDAMLGERGWARRRAFDQAVADRMVVALHRNLEMTLDAVLAADPVLPCRPTLRRWRREAPEFDAVLRWLLVARRGRTPVGQPWVEDIVDHIVEGGSFASYSREGGPSRTTLRRWHRRDPAFAREVAKACEWREEWLADQVLAAASGAPGEPVAERERAVESLKRRLGRLRHRPGAVHRPRPRGDEQAT